MATQLPSPTELFENTIRNQGKQNDSYMTTKEGIKENKSNTKRNVVISIIVAVVLLLIVIILVILYNNVKGKEEERDNHEYYVLEKESTKELEMKTPINDIPANELHTMIYNPSAYNKVNYEDNEEENENHEEAITKAHVLPSLDQHIDNTEEVVMQDDSKLTEKYINSA